MIAHELYNLHTRVATRMYLFGICIERECCIMCVNHSVSSDDDGVLPAFIVTYLCTISFLTRVLASSSSIALCFVLPMRSPTAAKRIRFSMKRAIRMLYGSDNTSTGSTSTDTACRCDPSPCITGHSFIHSFIHSITFIPKFRHKHTY